VSRADGQAESGMGGERARGKEEKPRGDFGWGRISLMGGRETARSASRGTGSGGCPRGKRRCGRVPGNAGSG